MESLLFVFNKCLMNKWVNKIIKLGVKISIFTWVLDFKRFLYLGCLELNVCLIKIL